MFNNTYVMGIDEAGRGPVLGPMVVAGVVMEAILLDKLLSLGLKDSKKLSAKKRHELFDLIQEYAVWSKITVLWPEEIDNAVINNGLNRLERDAFVNIMDAYPESIKVFIDSPQKPQVFTLMLEEKLQGTKELFCSFKADTLFPIVSASSILAKHSRDTIIEELKKNYGDFGSGYPSDPKTRRFISELKTPTFFVRKSWKTYSELSLL